MQARAVVAAALTAVALGVGVTSAVAAPPTPQAPTELKLVAATADSISVSWVRPAQATQFGLYVDGSRVGSTTKTDASFGGLRCGKKYELGVDAVGASGVRSARRELTASTAACADVSPPTKPASFDVTDLTRSSVTTSWEASRDNVGVTGYELTLDGVAAGVTTSTTFTFDGFGCKEKHKFTVRARDAAGNRSPEATVTAKTLRCPPKPPDNLMITGTTATSISLSWDRPKHAVLFGLYRDGRLLRYTLLTRATFGDLRCGTSYELGVDSLSVWGERSAQATVRASTADCADREPPTKPDGLAAVATASSITVSWHASTDDVGVVAYDLTKDGAPAGSTTSTTNTFGGLGCGETHTFGVRARDASGKVSAEATITTRTTACPDREPPTTPDGFVTDATDTSITVSWHASTDDVGVVAYDLTKDGAPAGSTTSTTNTFGGLGCGEPHTFGVRARDASGKVSAEGTVSASTRACPADVFVAPNGSDFKWTHLAATYDGATLRLYVDGTEVASRALTGGMPASGQPLRLGGNSIWGEWFAGLMDDARIYSRALTRDQIRASMDTAVPDATGLVAAYSFDGGAGANLADVSGNGHGGVISGATWSATGRHGGALAFDGVDDLVTIADSADLHLDDAMTLEAWVRPDALGNEWRTVIVKEQPGALVYALYANTDSYEPSAQAFVNGTDWSVRGVDPLPQSTCTRTDPCGSFARAYETARAGQVVEVAAGSYPEELVGSDPAKGADTVLFRPARDASVEIEGIEVRAQHVEFRDLTMGSMTTLATAEDVVLRNLTIRGGFFIFSSQRVSVLGGSVGPGVDFHPMIAAADGNTTPPRDILIDGVYFHDWSRSDSSVHTECLQIGGGDRITIRNSRFRNCAVMDLHVSWYGDAPMTKNVTIENNEFGTTVSGGFYTIGAYGYENLLIRNNSFAQEFTIFQDAAGAQGPFTNVRVIGNVAPRQPWDWCAADIIVYRYNVWDGATCDATDLNAPLGFVDAAAGNLHLVAGAAAINHGDPTSFPATDIDGDRRPQGGAPDAGADEFVPPNP